MGPPRGQVTGLPVSRSPRWPQVGTTLAIWLVIGLATPRWTGLDTPDSSFYLSLSLFGDQVTDRAPVDSYWWTRLGFIAPNQVLSEVLGPWGGFAAYRMILLLAIVAGSMVLLRQFTSLLPAAALTSMISLSTVVLGYLGNPYLTGSVLAGTVAVTACAWFDQRRAAAVAGIVLGWLVMVNPPGFLLAATIWLAVRIHRQATVQDCTQESAQEPAQEPAQESAQAPVRASVRAALTGVGIAAATGIGTFAVFLIAGRFMFPGMDWFGAYLQASGIDLSNFASADPVWLADPSLLVPLAGLAVSLGTWLGHRDRPAARLALLISATSIGFMLAFSPLMGGIAMEAPMYQAMLWPPALLALALAASSIAGSDPVSPPAWLVGLVALVGIGAIVVAGRWPGAWSPLACLLAVAGVTALTITGLQLAGRTRWPAAVALGCIGVLLAVSQLVQNSRGPLGLYYLSPYNWALNANPIESKVRVAVNAQQWLLDRTTADDRILVWVGGDWTGGDRELYVVAGMQLWGGENLVTLASTLDEPGAAKLAEIRPTAIWMVAPSTDQALAFWRSLPRGLGASQPQCYDATWTASPDEPTWANPAPVAAVHGCLTRLAWPAAGGQDPA